MEPVYDCKSGDYNRQLPPFKKYKLMSFNVLSASNIVSFNIKKSTSAIPVIPMISYQFYQKVVIIIIIISTSSLRPVNFFTIPIVNSTENSYLLNKLTSLVMFFIFVSIF